jgi:hypothetical protein
LRVPFGDICAAVAIIILEVRIILGVTGNATNDEMMGALRGGYLPARSLVEGQGNCLRQGKRPCYIILDHFGGAGRSIDTVDRCGVPKLHFASRHDMFGQAMFLSINRVMHCLIGKVT